MNKSNYSKENTESSFLKNYENFGPSKYSVKVTIGSLQCGSMVKSLERAREEIFKGFNHYSLFFRDIKRLKMWKLDYGKSTEYLLGFFHKFFKINLNFQQFTIF